jgi:phosphatidylserine decarboxylase
MASDAYKFVISLFAVAAVCAFMHLPAISAVLAFLGAFTCYFFRNPGRRIPAGDKVIVSPADGKVVRIAPIMGSDGVPTGHAVSIFLSIFDVHVNRSPIRGNLETLEYRRGRFLAAYEEDASKYNEQNILTIQGDGIRLVVKQIAGIIARRVVCWKKPGQPLARGELIGLIRFGSRVDVLMPRQVRILVKAGDRVKGGSSVIGDYA